MARQQQMRGKIPLQAFSGMLGMKAPKVPCGLLSFRMAQIDSPKNLELSLRSSVSVHVQVFYYYCKLP
jgi:hypothetical protein